VASVRSKADCDLTVAVLNNRLVSPDELVEMDDETFQSVVWPEDTWTVVDAPDDERTVEQLREELRRRDLPTSGKKADLVKRLADAPPEQPVAQPAPVVQHDTEE
jgi:hypothetical protein